MFRKLLVLLSFSLLITCFFPTTSVQAATRTIIFQVGSKVMNIDGNCSIMDTPPYIKQGRTYVPIRYLADGLRATTEYKAENQVIGIHTTDYLKYIIMSIGSRDVIISGYQITMDVAPEISNGRTMLPARAVAEALGGEVYWNPDSNEVVIEIITESQYSSPSIPQKIPQTTGTVVSKIDGKFEKLEHDAIFKLMNGQIWQQDEYYIWYYIWFYPDVTIYPTTSGYKMHVDGIDHDVYVHRLK